jgi:hypothetical protein
VPENLRVGGESQPTHKTETPADEQAELAAKTHPQKRTLSEQAVPQSHLGCPCHDYTAFGDSEFAGELFRPSGGSVNNDVSLTVQQLI